jgi:hypothetical protein
MSTPSAGMWRKAASCASAGGMCACREGPLDGTEHGQGT